MAPPKTPSPPQDCSISPASLFGGPEIYRQQLQQQQEQAAAGGIRLYHILKSSFVYDGSHKYEILFVTS